MDVLNIRLSNKFHLKHIKLSLNGTTFIEKSFFSFVFFALNVCVCFYFIFNHLILLSLPWFPYVLLF